MRSVLTPKELELRARVGARIRELAAARHLPLSRVADLSGVSRSTFWAILRGEYAASTDTFARLAGTLRVEPAAFLRTPRSRRSS